MSALIIAGIDVSDFLSPAGLNVDYANKYGDSIDTAEGKEVKKVLGQTITVSARLSLIDDTTVSMLKSAVFGGKKFSISGEGIHDSSEYTLSAFKQILAYKTGVNFWDIDISVSCYIVSDGL